MSLVEEIQKLSLMMDGKILPIYQDADITYIHKSKDGYAIAIPFDDDRVINESFVGITLSTSFLNFADKSIKVLYLFMQGSSDLKKFSYIGAEFIDVANRKSVLNNPYEWIDSWNEIFGNSKKKYMVTDVIAELASLNKIYSSDKTASWQGPKDGSHDIVMKDGVVEVKSTTNKTNNYISINSSFQIDVNLNEKIFFVRLEPKPYANSIDSLVKELVEMGYNENELETSLNEMGYRKGNRTRKQSYAILSINSYDVTSELFPVLSLDDLNNLTASKNIVGFNLKLDLSNIKHKVIL